MNRSITSISIAGISDNIKDNSYRLPAFQRDYVWGKEDARDLAESIIKKMPIGGILIWRTNITGGDKGVTKAFSGLNKVDTRKDNAGIVIDGQQRLTTIYHIFNGVDAAGTHKTPTPASFLYLNIARYKEFIKGGLPSTYNFIDTIGEDRAMSTHIKLSEIFTNAIPTNNDEVAELLYDIRSSFKSYSITIEEMGGSIDEAVSVFKLINMSGKPLEIIDVGNAIATLSSYSSFRSDVVKVGTRINTSLGRSVTGKASSFTKNVDSVKIMDEYCEFGVQTKDAVLDMDFKDIQSHMRLIQESFSAAASVIHEYASGWTKLPQNGRVLKAIARMYFCIGMTETPTSTQIDNILNMIGEMESNGQYINTTELGKALMNYTEEVAFSPDEIIHIDVSKFVAED